MKSFVAFLGVVALSGCALEHTGLAPLDGAVDAAGDAMRGDATESDAMGEDAARDAQRDADDGAIDGESGVDGALPDADAAVDADDGDPCTGDPDADGDGVSDACDRCGTGDDALDGDGDAIPDACDDWPCGERPSIADPVASESITISGAMVESTGNTAVVSAGATYAVVFSYAIQDTSCPGCIDQIELGTVPGNRVACVYDANPPMPGASGTVTRSMTAPTSPGRVDLRFNLGQRYSCAMDGATTWWGDEPPEAQTFATICVVP